MKRLITIFIIATTLFTGCNQDDSASGEVLEINSVEELDAIIDSCRNNKFESREEIENNLIGEWKLIGIRSGWVNEFSKKNIRLSIDQNSIVVTDLTDGGNSETDWTLKMVEVNNNEYFYLETNETNGAVFNPRLGMETFCQKYMFGTGRTDDGWTYVYTKVQ